MAISRWVPHDVSQARLLAAEVQEIDVQLPVGSEYQGGPVLVLDRSRMAFADASAGIVVLLDDRIPDPRILTRYGSGPGELEGVSFLFRDEGGFIVAANGNPGKAIRLSAAGEYLTSVTLSRSYSALDMLGESLVGFLLWPHEHFSSRMPESLQGAKLLRRYDEVSEDSLRWEAYDIDQRFAVSPRDLIFDSFGAAHEEVTAVVVATHDGMVYVLNTIHDNLQVYGARGQKLREFELRTAGPGEGSRFGLTEDGFARRYLSATDMSIDEYGTVFISRVYFRGTESDGDQKYRIDVHDSDLNYLGSYATSHPGVWIDAQAGVLLASSGGQVFEPALFRIDYGASFRHSTVGQSVVTVD